MLLRFSVANHLSIKEPQELSMAASPPGESHKEFVDSF